MLDSLIFSLKTALSLPNLHLTCRQSCQTHAPDSEPTFCRNLTNAPSRRTRQTPATRGGAPRRNCSTAASPRWPRPRARPSTPSRPSRSTTRTTGCSRKWLVKIKRIRLSLHSTLHMSNQDTNNRFSDFANLISKKVSYKKQRGEYFLH